MRVGWNQFAGLALLAILLALPPRIVAAAGGPMSAEELAKLTGEATPEADSLDQEADRLVAESSKTKGEADAAYAAARAKIDPKKLQEALKRGDKSVLSQETPESRRARELAAHADDLLKQAYEKAEEAGAQRAHAALEKRCLAPAAKEGAQSSDPDASPFLCGAVSAVASTPGPADPWQLCTCMRRYLTGLQKESDALQARAQGFVGQTRLNFSEPITAEQVEQAFKPATVDFHYLPPGASIERATAAFEDDARNIQKDLARGRIRRQLGQPYAPSDFDHFLLSRRGAYTLVVNVPAAMWRLHRIETEWQVAILGHEDSVRQKQIGDAYGRAYDTTLAGMADGNGWVHDFNVASSFIAAMRPFAREGDERDYRRIEEAALALRGLARDLRATQRRLTRDTEDWKSFAAKDGQTTAVGLPITAAEPMGFGITPSRDDPSQRCCNVVKTEGEFNADPETRIWVHFPESLPRTYPEITLINGGSISPSAALKISFEAKPEVVTGEATGAATGQRP
ncbi:MAG TPA: hypothetical protein VGU20_08170 [Stellaceae bacterium]|nr:hypothetical protein [Stellaceae bacterium]